MQAMTYNASQISEILVTDIYKGIKYYVISRSSHPCCYVMIPDCYCYNENEIECHGGITYNENYIYVTGGTIHTDSARFLGWDYAHGGDYFISVTGNVHEGVMHTTSEMIEDCKTVIDSIINANYTEISLIDMLSGGESSAWEFR